MLNRWSFSLLQFLTPLLWTIEKDNRVQHAQVLKLDNLIERALHKLTILIAIEILVKQSIHCLIISILQ